MSSVQARQRACPVQVYLSGPGIAEVTEPFVNRHYRLGPKPGRTASAAISTARPSGNRTTIDLRTAKWQIVASTLSDTQIDPSAQ
jgi:hypothetical protein